MSHIKLVFVPKQVLEAEHLNTIVTAINDAQTEIEEISGRVLPEATGEDEGKILQVINGACVLVDVQDSSIATFVESYIGEALGGEY